ncbi:ribonuclease H-like domain-containing protein [Tanacetum coccineum]
MDLEAKGGYVSGLGTCRRYRDDVGGSIGCVGFKLRKIALVSWFGLGGGGKNCRRQQGRIAICRLPEPVNFSYARNVVHQDIGKGIKREFSIARTPQQNGVAERRNRTLIEAARTMYSVVSKAMRVFNKRTRIVEETLNIRFLENTPNVIGNGPDWLFDVDSLTISMNYVPVFAGKQTNGIAGTRDYIVTEDSEEKPTEMDENGASDKDGKDDQTTRVPLKGVYS